MESKMTYSVSLGSVIDEFQLEEINKPEGSRDRPVNRSEVNRPGLALAGFFGYFEPGRIQIIGLSENDYISKLDDAKMREIFDRFFSTDPVAVVFSTSLPVSGTIIESADRFGVPLLRTSSKTSEFMAALIGSLSVSLAPRITRHGVLVRSLARAFSSSATARRKKRDGDRACQARTPPYRRRRGRDQKGFGKVACRFGSGAYPVLC